MLGALYTGITGMDAAATNMDVIGNNIANANTSAFKSSDVNFAAVYSETLVSIGGKAGNEEGKGVQVVGLKSAWEQGALETTQNSTDLSITGDGFFQVVEADGTSSEATYYTRAGQFRWDNEYYLVDPSDRRVQGYLATDVTNAVFDTSANVAIQIDQTTHSEPRIESNGWVTARNSSTGNRDYLYQVAIFNFPSNDGLRKVTGNLFEETTDSGQPTSATGNPPGQNGAGKVNTNSLEMSNVDLARQFVDLIVAQRAFQANSRVISSSAEILQEVINIIR
ncbi:putative Flagellar basal-body rod protein FlgG [uncultured Desulfobacterium sp.]|uniref:Flagellar hook protein FlgE n=1 Tax=uncultured Desulfobacterium sp. TaxID=201089 RepID=A0A445MTC5_9BACT|nr:putative Flagellar basal-body rod protein FlgG [uncultured Desulfobacterium sp.]